MTALAYLYRASTTPLRDWLKGQDIALVGQRVHAGGPGPDPATGQASIALQRVGGTTDNVLDRALFQFDVWAAKGSGHVCETVAMALASLLESTSPGTQVTEGLVFEGATVESAVWLPDPASQTPRFVLTVEVVVKATAPAAA